jgi:hypothetical protein
MNSVGSGMLARMELQMICGRASARLLSGPLRVEKVEQGRARRLWGEWLDRSAERAAPPKSVSITKTKARQGGCSRDRFTSIIKNRCHVVNNLIQRNCQRSILFVSRKSNVTN